jgi:hypothetical protein
LTALAVATPLPGRRKFRLLLIGYAVLLARLAVAVGLPVARMSGGLGDDTLFGMLAGVVWWAFINPPIMSYLPPLAVWWALVAISNPNRSVEPLKVVRPIRVRG